MGDNNNKDGKKKNQKLKILNNRRILPDISGNSTKKITISDDICKNNNLFNLVLHKGNEIIKRDTHISTINIDITNEKNDNKDKEIKLVPEMLNLLGCSKENFKKLIGKMNYKTYQKDKDSDIYFKYSPIKKIKKTFKRAV